MDVQIHRKATRTWPRPARTKHAITIDGKVVLVIAAGLGEGPGPEQALLNAWEGATGLGVTSARNFRPAFVSAPNDTSKALAYTWVGYGSKGGGC